MLSLGQCRWHRPRLLRRQGQRRRWWQWNSAYWVHWMKSDRQFGCVQCLCMFSMCVHCTLDNVHVCFIFTSIFLYLSRTLALLFLVHSSTRTHIPMNYENRFFMAVHGWLAGWLSTVVNIQVQAFVSNVNCQWCISDSSLLDSHSKATIYGILVGR